MIKDNNDSVQTKSELMFASSSLGLALSKIGIKIGSDTGASLNQYIKKKSDKSGSLTSCDSQEEKALDKMKKSKQCKGNKSEVQQSNKKRCKKQNIKESKKCNTIINDDS